MQSNHIELRRLKDWLQTDGKRLSHWEDYHLTSCRECITKLKELLEEGEAGRHLSQGVQNRREKAS